MKSMTAFARTQSTTEWGAFSWELRSVNQRFLEINFKLPDNYRHLEMPIREQLKSTLLRGKLEVVLKTNEHKNSNAFQVNQTILQPLVNAVNEVQQSLMEATHVNPLEVLNLPGVLQTESITEDGQQQRETELLIGLMETLDSLNANRQREGQALANILLTRSEDIQQQVELAQQLLPEIVENQTIKLRQRIQTLIDEQDQTRFHQEAALLAQKLDIQEELDRLHTHLIEVRHIIDQPGAVGRRLDFLMQELNREANTLGSKSADSRTSKIAVELKVLIEQMREQVQNIE